MPLMAIPAPSHMLFLIVPTKKSFGGWHCPHPISAAGIFVLKCRGVYWSDWTRGLGRRVMETDHG